MKTTPDYRFHNALCFYCGEPVRAVRKERAPEILLLLSGTNEYVARTNERTRSQQASLKRRQLDEHLAVVGTPFRPNTFWLCKLLDTGGRRHECKQRKDDDPQKAEWHVFEEKHPQVSLKTYIVGTPPLLGVACLNDRDEHIIIVKKRALEDYKEEST